MGKSYINPVLRNGSVCSPAPGYNLTFEQAIIVGKYFENRLPSYKNSKPINSIEEYKKEFLGFCKGKNITARITEEEGKDLFRIKYLLSPIIRLPAFYIEFQGNKLVSRESVTVCTGESATKLWISVSQQDDYYSHTIKELNYVYDYLNSYCELRMPFLLHYYSNILDYLSKSNRVFTSTNFGSPFKIDTKLYIKIFSVETNANLEDILLKCLKHGRTIAMPLIVDTPQYQNVLKPFINFSKDIAALSDINDFQFFVQNTTPMYYGSRSVRPYIYSGKSTMQRQNLIMSIKNIKRSSIPIEFYFTIGTKDNIFNERRYRNSALASRSIMNEVGRVH